MGPAWGPGCGFIVDFLVAVRGGWFGMTILLCPVTGVETGGDDVELVEPFSRYFKFLVQMNTPLVYTHLSFTTQLPLPCLTVACL